MSKETVLREVSKLYRGRGRTVSEKVQEVGTVRGRDTFLVGSGKVLMVTQTL